MEDQREIALLSRSLEEVGGDAKGVEGADSCGSAADFGVCAICLEKIVLQETALVKGTLGSARISLALNSSSGLTRYAGSLCFILPKPDSVTCILRWAAYKQKPSCPQCKHPFESLNVHRSLDGCIHDYMFEESVCLLLRATWFVPLTVEAKEEAPEELEDYAQYYNDQDDADDDDGDELDESYYISNSSGIRIGNRRWGDNGYVRAGRKEARPVGQRSFDDSGAGPSRCPKKKESSKVVTGRRAKRALKREAADKAAAAKHQQHLQRLGRK
ncbi:hypothetical protein COCNU_16G002070 [Cocos nucifera]|uniref:Uncharacterized protein n=1 Tax=Cocos nucifera TaxID=13894 RepID=A0A8K0J026_COCNU|nr:hypothetical protein COCNU_16G002070 [Cocos nucifera]